jgi:predicted CoA-binding protein
MTSTAAAIESFVSEPALALVGASRSSRKFGNLAMRELGAKGYRVYPIHPSAPSIDGVTCYRRFADLPERVNAVLIVVPPKQAVAVIREAAAAGIEHVWLQQGAESPEAETLCRGLGLEAVTGECILMFTHPTGVHKAHRWLRGMFGGLPRSAPAWENAPYAS